MKRIERFRLPRDAALAAEPRHKVAMPEPLIITLGCRLNAYESEVMRRHASDAGLENCVIVNTCAVTREAVAQARQTIRRTRRDRPVDAARRRSLP